MNRTALLEDASVLVSGSREEDYGPPAVNFANIAQRWSQILGVDVEPWAVALMMADLKVARLASSRKPHIDTFTDIAGYAALAAELADESS